MMVSWWNLRDPPPELYLKRQGANVELTYFDFDLEIERTEQGYKVDVQKSLAGEPEVDLPSAQVAFDLDAFLAGIGRPARTISRALRPVERPQADVADTLRTFGTQLFETFFADQIGISFRRSLDEAEGLGAGLRIRLHLNSAPELAELPWEYLYDPLEDDFVTRSVRTPLVRYLEVPQLIRPFQVSPPLKVLVIIASPTDHVQLDVRQEWDLLRGALSELEQQGLVQVELLDRATVPRFLEYLSQDSYHVIHFIGHGDFDLQQRQGVFLMETEDRQGHPVSTEDLRTLLRDERGTLRLVVLNACKGARSAAGDPFAGLAQGLIRAGILAVIAMQFAITDDAAIDFAREFYRRVAEGAAIDGALGEVRKAVFLKGHRLEWGTPVLFMRSLTGQIFDVPAQQPPPGAGADEPAPLEVQPPPGPAATIPDDTPALTRVNQKILKWFVNRDRQRKAFLAMLEQRLQKQIMLVKAPTYMGKTWLINWLLGKCLTDQVPVAHFDFDLLARRPLDYLAVVRHARDQLGPDHFGEMTQLVEEASKDALGAGEIESDRVRQEIKAKILDSFFQSLGNLSQDQIVAILIDAYERATGEPQEWIEELLLRIRLDRLPNVLVVIAGQEIPVLDEEDYGSFLIPSDLSSLDLFDPDDVARYLQLRDLTHLDAREMYDRAHGHPRELSHVVELALLGL